MDSSFGHSVLSVSTLIKVACLASADCMFLQPYKQHSCKTAKTSTSLTISHKLSFMIVVHFFVCSQRFQIFFIACGTVKMCLKRFGACLMCVHPSENSAWAHLVLSHGQKNTRPTQPNTCEHVLKRVPEHTEKKKNHIFVTGFLTCTHTHTFSLSINGCCRSVPAPHLDPIGLRKGWTLNKSLLPLQRTVNRPSTTVSEEEDRETDRKRGRLTGRGGQE